MVYVVQDNFGGDTHMFQGSAWLTTHTRTHAQRSACPVRYLADVCGIPDAFTVLFGNRDDNDLLMLMVLMIVG